MKGSNKTDKKNNKNREAKRHTRLNDWRVFNDNFEDTPGGKLLGMVAILIFSIPILVSQFMGLKKVDAFVVELGGWAIEAAIVGIIYLIVRAIKKK